MRMMIFNKNNISIDIKRLCAKNKGHTVRGNFHVALTRGDLSASGSAYGAMSSRVSME